ncbi:HopJ type III effector protein [Flavobacterium sp. J27]|uniref:HopJ type III effector protein n=1 Tax=Flavobacterium sp. J27 TaxID=2060419 RepID=UPI0010305D60|nr:HopJ type III effector protein [Flavobacterium sp. J27]
MTISNLIEAVQKAEIVAFSEVIATIDVHFEFTPTFFTNGAVTNKANTNNGSCKVFSFAKMYHLDVKETLFLFGEHYQKVLATPDEMDHQNIRNFINSGWEGISFEGKALELK